jgi:hypothetical protein
MMKCYQSPLFITGFVIILSGLYYTIRTMVNINDWGLLYGIPALIAGGTIIICHFILNWLIKAHLKHKIIIELIITILILIFLFNLI